MKKRIWNYMFLIGAVVALASCSDDDDSNNSSNPSVNQVESTAESGSWKITYFFDTDSEETTNFTGYTFEFHENGHLMATNGSNNVEGTWSVTSSDDSNDDSPDNDLDFNILFAAPPEFEELSDDWDFVSVSDDKIELIDASGGNGGTDYLTFEKI